MTFLLFFNLLLFSGVSANLFLFFTFCIYLYMNSVKLKTSSVLYRIFNVTKMHDFEKKINS